MLQWKCSPISARGGGNGGDCLEDYVLIFFVTSICNSIKHHWRRTLVQYIIIVLLTKRKFLKLPMINIHTNLLSLNSYI